MSGIYSVAIVQHSPKDGQPEENIALGISYMREAKTQGADIVLFPECWITGYWCPVPEEESSLKPADELFESSAEFCDWCASVCTAEQISRFADAARELGIGVVVTGFTAGRRLPQNSAFLIDSSGRTVLKYSKVHTCDFGWERYLESGNEFPVGDVDGVKVGIMICYDREYPESARELMMNGAELVLVPNCCGAMAPRLMELAVRAMENMVCVAMANPPGDDMGRSCAFSPIVWGEDGRAVSNEVVCASESYDGILIARFDMDRIREYRAREDLGKYRKPGAYINLRRQ